MLVAAFLDGDDIFTGIEALRLGDVSPFMVIGLLPRFEAICRSRGLRVSGSGLEEMTVQYLNVSSSNDSYTKSGTGSNAGREF